VNTQIFKNQTALVTGASSGLGVDFARELAARGANLILVARREELLRSLAADLEREYAVDVRVIPLDLTAPCAPEQLVARLRAEGAAVDILVNNAGFGLFGAHMDIPWEQEKSMLELDVIVLASLTKLFLRDMLARNRGYVLLVSSIAAYQPTPTYASYAGAKAYVLNMGEALNYELRRTGVGVTVISPGVTSTEFFKVAGQSQLTLYQRLTMMKSRDVARIGIESMIRRKPSVVPGGFNAFIAFGTRLVSRRVQAAIGNLLMTLK
jgi:uncharacterized protein